MIGLGALRGAGNILVLDLDGWGGGAFLKTFLLNYHFHPQKYTQVDTFS